MILDSRNEFCDATSLNTGAAGTYLLGNQIDLNPNGGALTPGQIGATDDVYLVISVQTGITVASGTGTVQFLLASDASASIATDGSATVHMMTKAFATSTTAIAAGTVLAVIELPKSFSYERYLGILQVTGTTAINAGKIDAFLTSDPALWAAYNSPAQA